MYFLIFFINVHPYTLSVAAKMIPVQIENSIKSINIEIFPTHYCYNQFHFVYNFNEIIEPLT